MKVKFCVDSSANIHSCKTEIIDLEKCYDIDAKEWAKMSEDDKHELLKEWANEHIQMWIEEL